jgi:hypothetical protein
MYCVFPNLTWIRIVFESRDVHSNDSLHCIFRSDSITSMVTISCWKTELTQVQSPSICRHGCLPSAYKFWALRGCLYKQCVVREICVFCLFFFAMKKHVSISGIVRGKFLKEQNIIGVGEKKWWFQIFKICLIKSHLPPSHRRLGFSSCAKPHSAPSLWPFTLPPGQCLCCL